MPLRTKASMRWRSVEFVKPHQAEAATKIGSYGILRHMQLRGVRMWRVCVAGEGGQSLRVSRHREHNGRHRLLLNGRTTHRRPVRHLRSEDRKQLQSVHVST